MAQSHSVRWTPRANRDLLDIFEYVAHDSPAAAEGLARDIRKKAEQLSIFPSLGREVAPGIRTLVPHRHYLLTYRIKRNRIEILQVKHVARGL